MTKFQPPSGYYWLLERGLVGYAPHSQLQPWYYLQEEEIFNVTKRWPEVEWAEGELIAFAKRQDCDDLACFHMQQDNMCKIVVIHGWAPKGFDLIIKLDNFWEWLKLVVDDISEWVEMDN